MYVKYKHSSINLNLNADILTLIFNAVSKEAISFCIFSFLLLRSCYDIILALDDRGDMSQCMRSLLADNALGLVVMMHSVSLEVFQKAKQ